VSSGQPAIRPASEVCGSRGASTSTLRDLAGRGSGASWDAPRLVDSRPARKRRARQFRFARGGRLDVTFDAALVVPGANAESRQSTQTLFGGQRMRRCVHLVGLFGLLDALAVSVLLGPGPLNAADLSDLGRPPTLGMVGAGKDRGGFFASSELFEPPGRKLTVCGAIRTSCSGDTATLLPTGRELAGLRAASPLRRQRLNSTASGKTLTISPSSVAVVPGTSVTFTPSGGTGGYAWSFVENENKSGGTVDQGGLYTAGATAGVTDVLRVTDVPGDVGTVKIFVVNLQIEPPSKTLTVGATQTFTARGFIDSYAFRMLQNQSGATISSTSGVYTAGNDAGTDRIVLTDSLGFTASAVITVVGPLVIKPPAVTLEPLESKSFTASGGQEPYIFSLVSESDASVTPDGVYTAGGATDAGDVVRATDSIGNTAEADVTVTTDYRPPSGAGCGTTPEHLFPFLAFAALPMLLPRRSREESGAVSLKAAASMSSPHSANRH
jgi:hypothetical protein